MWSLFLAIQFRINTVLVAKNRTYSFGSIYFVQMLITGVPGPLGGHEN